MARVFDITAAADTVRLDTKGQGDAAFTVSNASGRRIRGRAKVVPKDPASAGWLSLVGESERDFPSGGTQLFATKISVPPDARSGAYPFRLDMVSVDNPDEGTAQGPTISFTVAEALPPPPKSYRTWFILALILVLAIAGAAIWFVLRRPEPANFAGSWSTSFAQLDLKQDGEKVTGEYRLYGSDRSSAAVKVEGTVDDRTLSGTIGDPAANTRFAVTIDPATRTFNGTWGAGKPWCGVSGAESELPAGCSFTGLWMLVWAGGPVQVDLKQKANTVEGKIDMGPPDHQMFGVKGGMSGWAFHGEFDMGPDLFRVPIRWTSVNQQFQQFHGIQYEVTLSEGYDQKRGVNFTETCGFRKGSSAPVPCRDPLGIVYDPFALDAAPGPGLSQEFGNGPIKDIKVHEDFRATIVARAVTTKPGQLVAFGVRRADSSSVWVRMAKAFWDNARPFSHVALHQRLADIDSVDTLDTAEYSGDVVHFMIERRGNAYTFSFSPDGKSWKPILGKSLEYDMGNEVELYATVLSDVRDGTSLKAEFSSWSVNKP